MEYKKETMARAMRNNLSISTKSSVEICRHIRGKNITRAIIIMEKAIDKKEAIPYRRYTGDVGHKTKIGSGKYPEKACKAFLEVLKELESNARDKSIDTENLVIKIAKANKGPRQGKYGRSRGKVKKNTHVELIAEPKTINKRTQTKRKKQPIKKEEPKKETVKEEKPVETKKEEPKKEETVKETKESKPEVKKEEPVKENPIEVKKEEKPKVEVKKEE